MTTTAPSARTNVDEVALDLVFQLMAGTYRSPSEALRSDVDSGAFGEAVAALAAMLDLPAPELATPPWATLQASYVDLFVSSGSGVAAPPYVGYAIDDELMGPSTQLLGAAFADHGIALQDDWHDLPDHVAAVAEGGLHLVRTGRAQAAFDLLEGFVAPWFERFSGGIAAKDVSSFYGPVSRFLHDAIREVTRETRS